ncbi:tRNA (uracil-5-)-methyltransferase [Idiomarina fontislapidosi]|uniref:tRNA/tmRNA (uracil-C(5))-methyltransferase n=1 Tax=Idiomarina fontislapidosi TaxID=263723 RepID=A0A432Y8D5_9GAMM|nr:tRNA (uridine(54)-C5)-methyltransferase TrmA [Idiomarina fontislapidosi]PYE32413.1 tRNA (uracil-5-)-methyltransferase [Idiomarina fontislapidosi]RUO57116.1 tRNA (uridine(54)-C5)-methyltransferase TrmA [Idiomarina fontislapidosi]
MTYKTIDTAEYPAQFADKAKRLAALLSPYYKGELDLHESPRSHYRMRAEFRVWHEQDDLYYIMFNPETREKIRMDQFVPGSELINTLMTAVRDYVIDKPILRNKLFQVDFLTTTTNEAVISCLYHKQLDKEWEEAAEQMHKALSSLTAKLGLIGRARKQKHVIGTDEVIESLTLGQHSWKTVQTENAFTQPNAAINQQMITWAMHAVGTSSHDLLELYCGNGNFTLPLATQFEHVLATEISKRSVASAQTAAQMNKVDNVAFVRMSSEEFSEALKGDVEKRRLQDIDLTSYDFGTVLVDPPRAGLDDLTLNVVSEYQRILYISCNPETLIQNIEALSDKFDVTKAALFDQFPYTHHIEAGVLLERKAD